MQFLERDLEDIIFNADKENLSKRGLPINGKLKRQLKIGNYGIADLVSYKKCAFYEQCEMFPENNTITVFELKNDIIDDKAFWQGLGYMKGIQSFFDKRDTNYGIDFKLVLIGRKISNSSSFIYLPDMFENIFLYTYEYNIDGIFFKRHHGYSLVNEGF